MSRMPGIGHDWYQKFKTDIYPKGIYTKIDGKKVMPPDYYDRQFQKEDPDGYKNLSLTDQEKQSKLVHGTPSMEYVNWFLMMMLLDS